MAEFKTEKGRNEFRKPSPEFPPRGPLFPEKPPIKRRRSPKVKTICPYCDTFRGMFTKEQRCEHMRRNHESKVMEILNKVERHSIDNLKNIGNDPFCWAAGRAYSRGTYARLG